MTPQPLNSPVDVDEVFASIWRDGLTSDNCVAFEKARAAVAELIEAAKEMRGCLQVLRDAYQAEPEDIAALNRADAALARIGGVQ